MPTVRICLRPLAPLTALLLAGCTNIFLQPSGPVYYHKPEEVGARYEVIVFASADKTPLTGLFFPAVIGPAKGTVLHFHGNAQNVTAHFLASYWLAEKGFNVFIFDYRGYGASGGKPSITGAVHDGIAALEYVRTRPDVDPKRVVIFGQSLGAAIALAATARDPDIRAMVLESPFSSFRSIAQIKAGRIPVLGWLLKPLTWLLISGRHNPSNEIRSLDCPLLIIHGDADKVVPLNEGRSLFARAHEPKTFWIVPSGAHIAAFTRPASEYRQRLATFLDESLR